MSLLFLQFLWELPLTSATYSKTDLTVLSKRYSIVCMSIYGKANFVGECIAFNDFSYSLFIESERVPDELKHISKQVCLLNSVTSHFLIT